MTREIKFRAFVKNVSKMVHFDSYDKILGNARNFDYCEEYGELVFEIKEFPGIGNIPSEYDMDNIELMQYTGLKDKNGKEIYEGDILELVSTIGINRGKVIVELKEYQGDRGKEFGYQFYSYLPNNAEVVGNIYENPELLEKEE